MSEAGQARADRAARRLVGAVQPVPDFVANMRAGLGLLAHGGRTLPLTLADRADLPNCYLCAPSTAYIDYALEELRHFSRTPPVFKALKLLVGLAGLPVRAMGLDHQVQPNNWLFSTSIQPPGIDADIPALTADLVGRWPDRAIVWRSLNDGCDGAAIAAFRRAGYRLLPARQVYVYDCRETLPEIRRDMRNDLRLLKRSALQAVGPDDIGEADFPRIAELYRLLYLEKYTALNPQYTPAFMRAMHREGIVEFHGFRGADGLLQAVIGFFCLDDVMTAPIVGYDTALPQALGLYRLLVVHGMLEARERRMLYNMSAGAALFKRTRGARPAIEYTAVYNRHLPFQQRLAARTVEAILQGIGVPLMKKFAL